MHPKVFLRNESFESLLASPDLTEYEKESAKFNRKIHLNQLYEAVNKAHESGLTEDDEQVWIDAKQQHAIENAERVERGEEPLDNGEFLKKLYLSEGGSKYICSRHVNTT